MNASHIPILVALVGLVLYMCPTPAKVAEAGRLMFAVGLLVALFLWRRGALFVGALAIVASVGCGSTLAVAADVANAAALAGETAAPILTEVCVEPMKAALAAQDRAAGIAIANRCDVPIAAYDALRVAHVALRSAIVALASGKMPPDLFGTIAQVVEASVKLGQAIGGVR